MSIHKHETIDYVEFPSQDLEATKAFFKETFDWSFQDYGAEYTAFGNEGIEGGFYLSDKKASAEQGSALIIFYSEDLEDTQGKIKENGGRIIKEIFSFPGGRRFHFTEPAGNEFAVWSDKGLEENS